MREVVGSTESLRNRKNQDFTQEDPGPGDDDSHYLIIFQRHGMQGSKKWTQLEALCVLSLFLFLVTQWCLEITPGSELRGSVTTQGARNSTQVGYMQGKSPSPLYYRSGLRKALEALLGVYQEMAAS